jgi:hypothetical protein
MRKLSALFIVSLIIVQAFYNLGVTIYWAANHNYIATVLCENRDKKALHCDGKCYLKKKLAAANQDKVPAGQEEQKSLKKGLETFEFLIDSGWSKFDLAIFHNNLIPTIPGCCSVEPAERVFHPPASPRA